LGLLAGLASALVATAWARIGKVRFTGPPAPWRSTLMMVLASAALGASTSVVVSSSWRGRPFFVVEHGPMHWAVLGLMASAMGEELFARGYLQPRLATILPARSAIVLASVVFVALHSRHAWVAVVIASLLFGWLAAGTRSVVPAMAAHVGWNAGLRWFLPIETGPREEHAAWLVALPVCLVAAAYVKKRMEALSTPVADLVSVPEARE
jgi:membrane protease YdiL (CAAX protease family)